jgi:hypothetical protein
MCLFVFALCGIFSVSANIYAFKLFETDVKISQRRDRLIGFKVSNRLKCKNLMFGPTASHHLLGVECLELLLLKRKIKMNESSE